MIRINRNDYTSWIKKYDIPSPAKLEKIGQMQSVLSEKPLISVIMPVFNPNTAWLIKAIESVCQQSYPFWELCIADDASSYPEIHNILSRYEKNDPRIKVVYRSTNGHIAACSNSALEIATGNWIALLDHDDEISSTALFWVVDAINRNPTVKLIYSDEDKIDKSGNRSDPYFKSDWNPDLFYAQNMFSHLGVYNADLVRQVGGFREGFDGSQDYDLVLRCTERICANEIFHIPRVLYHWRIHNESTAYSVESKPYAMVVGEKALNEHFQRTKISAKALLVGYGYKITYALPEKPPMVSIIIPTRNGLDLLRVCIESIVKLTTYPDFEVIVIDNGSDDHGTLDYFGQITGEDSRIRVIRMDQPFNYSSLNNQAVKEARGEYIALVNNDIRVINAEWLTEMMGLTVQPGVGAVGAKLLYPNDTIQHAGIILGLGFHGIAGCAHNRIDKGNKGYFGRASLTNSFSAITAACMVVRKSIFEEMNGFNENELPVSYNDVDFCLRLLEAGYRNVYTPYAELYHNESASRGKIINHDEHIRMEAENDYFRQRWSHLLLNDPAYNPNLTLQYSDFSLAWPPRIKIG